MNKFLIIFGIIFIAAAGLLMFNIDDVEVCHCDHEEEESTETDCNDASCLYCAATLVGIQTLSPSVGYSYTYSEPLCILESVIIFGDFTDTPEQPPRA